MLRQSEHHWAIHVSMDCGRHQGLVTDQSVDGFERRAAARPLGCSRKMAQIRGREAITGDTCLLHHVLEDGNDH